MKLNNRCSKAFFNFFFFFLAEFKTSKKLRIALVLPETLPFNQRRDWTDEIIGSYAVQ